MTDHGSSVQLFDVGDMASLTDQLERGSGSGGTPDLQAYRTEVLEVYNVGEQQSGLVERRGGEEDGVGSLGQRAVITPRAHRRTNYRHNTDCNAVDITILHSHSIHARIK